MSSYKNTWLSKYESIPEAAHGFPTCMYTMSLEAWRRGLQVKFNMKRKKSMMSGLSYTITDGDRTHRFHGSRGDATTREAIKICVNKGITANYLRNANVPVPEGNVFASDAAIDELLNYAEQIGYPLVLKPSTGAGGAGVVTNIKSKSEMEKNIIQLKRKSPQASIIIERFFVGEDFRINVFNGKVIGAFHRRAQSVLGDGKHSLKELLDFKNKERNASPFLAKSKIKIDKKMKVYLAENNKTPEYIPEENERVYLRRNGEFFGQRDAINVTDTLSQKMLKNAEAAANAIPGLSIGGVDMLIDLEKDECVINEVNSIPQISNHIFPIEGNAIDIPRIILDHYFPETKYDASVNTQFYYDFKPIIDNFRNGTAVEMMLPPVPSGKQVAKQFTVTGEDFSPSYFARMKREAADYAINGSLEMKEENEIVFTISSSEEKLEGFQHFIQNAPNKSVQIKRVKEQAYEGAINIGFTVKNK